MNFFHLNWRDGSWFSKRSRFAQDNTWKSFWSGPLYLTIMILIVGFKLTLVGFWWIASLFKVTMFGNEIWTQLCGIILSRKSCMNWLAFGFYKWVLYVLCLMTIVVKSFMYTKVDDFLIFFYGSKLLVKCIHCKSFYIEKNCTN